jgi:outer membrane protein
MGLSPDMPIIVAELDDSNLMKEPFDGHVGALMERAKEQRVDLLATRAGLENAKDTLRKLERSQLGTITARTSASMGGDDFGFGNNARSQSIGVSVSIPLFTGFNDTYTRHAARKSLEATQERLIRSELTVENDVFKAWQNYQTAKQQWEVTWDQLATATQLRDVALGRYKEGIGSILDVLNAQLQYSNALQGQLTTRFNLLTTRVDLVRAVGVLNLDNMTPENASNASTTTQSTQ